MQDTEEKRQQLKAGYNLSMARVGRVTAERETPSKDDTG